MRASRQRAMAPIARSRRIFAIWAGVLLLTLSIAVIVVGLALAWRHAQVNDLAPWVVGALLGAALAIGYVACGAILTRLHKPKDKS